MGVTMKTMCWLLALVCAGNAVAGVPEELRGAWVIAPKETEAFMKTSPKWKPEDAKYLPKIMERMSLAVYEIGDGTLTMSIRRSKRTLPIVLKESGKKKHVFETKVGENTVVLTMTVNAQGFLNIRSSATDDMDYYLWKRTPAGVGTADAAEGKDDVANKRQGHSGTVTKIDKKNKTISLRTRIVRVTDMPVDESAAPVYTVYYNEKTLFRKIKMERPGKGIGAAVGIDDLKVGDYVRVPYDVRDGKKTARAVFWK